MSAYQSEVNAAVHLIDAGINDLFDTLRHMTPDDIDLRDALVCREILATPSLGLVRERLETLIGDALGTYETVVQGVGVVRRTHKKNRSEWKSDDLLRMVLDTRRVDPATGEIESDVDKIKHVYPLAGYQARRTALKDRGIDPDDFCVVEERPGWNLRIID